LEDNKFKGMICTVEDITSRKFAEESLKASLREKEILLMEIQHRVKNNLITISGIIALQLNQSKDDESRNALITCMNRINAMSRVHRKLYQSQDYSRINIGEYIAELVQELCRSYGFSNEDITMDISDIPIDVNIAIPLGLLVNELITNIMKHAFPDGSKGKIKITMSSMDSHFILTVSDNGIGIPPYIDLKNTESVGLLLVNQLVDQIDGTVQFISKDGTKVITTFPMTQERFLKTK
jgi:two-component sensor histidine kinase